MILQQEARTVATNSAAAANDEIKKLFREQRDASKAYNTASHQAKEAAASLADKRAELAAVKDSNQELVEQHIQETQVHTLFMAGVKI